MLYSLVILFTIIPLASFSWGLQRHFRAPDGMPSGMRALTAASTIASALFLYLVVTRGVCRRAGRRLHCLVLRIHGAVLVGGSGDEPQAAATGA